MRDGGEISRTLTSDLTQNWLIFSVVYNAHQIRYPKHLKPSGLTGITPCRKFNNDILFLPSHATYTAVPFERSMR